MNGPLPAQYVVADIRACGHQGHGRLAMFAAMVATTMILLAACGASRLSAAPSSTVYRWGVVGNKGKIAQLEVNRPTTIAGVTGRIVQIATSNSDGYALTSTGQVFGWGVNSYGELGDGKPTPYATTAVKVDFPAGVRITSLANPMPFDAGLAIDSTGRAWGWGLNGDDDLCLSGLVETRPRPVPLPDVTLATGARTHALFDSKGALYACGSGDAGELGNGSTTSTATPTHVTGLPPQIKIVALTSSWEGSGALLANGEYYDWGYNAAGQLGDGTTTNSASPVEVRLPGPVRQAFQGGSGAKNGQTITILKNGSVWAWGNNDRGQLGIGNRTGSKTPVRVRVPTGTTFVTVSSGGYATYAIDNTGDCGRGATTATGNSPPAHSTPTRRSPSTSDSTSPRSPQPHKTSPDSNNATDNPQPSQAPHSETTTANSDHRRVKNECLWYNEATVCLQESLHVHLLSATIVPCCE